SERATGRWLGPGLVDGDLALLLVAPRHGGVLQRLAILLAGLVDAVPEHGPVVEVEEGVGGTAARLECREVRRAAGLLGQAGAGEPEQPDLAHGPGDEELGSD